MKAKVMLITLVSLLLMGAGQAQFFEAIDPVALREASRLDEYLGKRVVIHGKVSKTKVPTIHGIEVATPANISFEQSYQASGILKKTVVTDKMAKELDAEGVAHRGSGTFYRIVDPKTDQVVQVETPKPIGKSE